MPGARRRRLLLRITGFVCKAVPYLNVYEQFDCDA